MKKKFYQTREFLAEQREWYEKARESGLRDIETIDPKTGDATPLLKGVSQGDLARGLYKPETQEYYRVARGHKHTIRDPLRRYVWGCHAEGLSKAKIHERLKERRGTGLRYIARVISEERKKMLDQWIGSGQ